MSPCPFSSVWVLDDAKTTRYLPHVKSLLVNEIKPVITVQKSLCNRLEPVEMGKAVGHKT